MVSNDGWVALKFYILLSFFVVVFSLLLHACKLFCFPAPSNSQVGTCTGSIVSVLLVLIYLFFTVTNRTDCLLDIRGSGSRFFVFFEWGLGSVGLRSIMAQCVHIYSAHTHEGNKTGENKTGTCNERSIVITREPSHIQRSLLCMQITKEL